MKYFRIIVLILVFPLFSGVPSLHLSWNYPDDIYSIETIIDGKTIGYEYYSESFNNVMNVWRVYNNSTNILVEVIKNNEGKVIFESWKNYNTSKIFQTRENTYDNNGNIIKAVFVDYSPKVETNYYYYSNNYKKGKLINTYVNTSYCKNKIKYILYFKNNMIIKALRLDTPNGNLTEFYNKYGHRTKTYSDKSDGLISQSDNFYDSSDQLIKVENYFFIKGKKTEDKMNGNLKVNYK